MIIFDIIAISNSDRCVSYVTVHVGIKFGIENKLQAVIQSIPAWLGQMLGKL